MAGNGIPLYTIASKSLTDSIVVNDSSADGKYLVVSDAAGASIFETGGNGTPLYTITRQGDKERFPFVAFSENPNYLFVGRVNRSEKQFGKTGFYDIRSGKLEFEIPVIIGANAISTPSGKYLYSVNLGGVTVWNSVEKRYFEIPLATETPSNNYDPKSTVATDTSPHNTETITISPDEKYILRHGDDIVTIIDIETGKEVQSIFDNQKVKFDKQNKIKKSGLGHSGWAADGRAVYAFDTGGFMGNRRTVSLWARK